MFEGNFDLFFVLLRLKSYLISLVDDPSECEDTFEYTNEYLDRVYPDEAEFILSILEDGGIKNDCDIAFDSNIHIKFKEIVQKANGVKELPAILNDLRINLEDEKTMMELESIKKLRSFKLNHILNVLMQLIKTWSLHNELEKKVNDLSELDEERVIRPDESQKLSVLGKNTELSQKNIALLTEKYLELLTDYFFNYGGNVTLQSFVDSMSKFESRVNVKYQELLRKHGLDPGFLDD
ncbi:MAG: hypothetical protein SCALA702_13110 [Melioribacteraceae bacterium]|nr:MAG: hypothetical protein SCALA702_13110 [Melioribacteraceae bacterium]